MSKLYNNIIELIGNTPLVKLNSINNGVADVYVKLEYFNPANSIKDRAALGMLNDAEAKGLINKNTVIIEPTSGNTGIGLALIAAVKGYRVILTMPENMSLERQKMLKGYGAELVLTPKELGMAGAVEKANELAKTSPDSYIPMQFSNSSNPLIHEETTAEEIWNDTDGKVDIVVAGIGTGGTISGIGKGLKKHNGKIEIVGVEPKESPLITEGFSNSHDIQGIGANFIPENYISDYIDKVIAIEGKKAIETAKLMGKKEGMLCGISSGAAVAAALDLSMQKENEGKMIVAIAPDYGERYISTKLFED